ncbi:MAG: hypothetical protein RR365_07185 [Bacteroides sp.]
MNSDWQDWAVALVMVFTLTRIAYLCYSFFRQAKKNKNPCANCASGCALKDQLEKKRQECKEAKPLAKKNCCG